MSTQPARQSSRRPVGSRMIKNSAYFGGGSNTNDETDPLRSLARRTLLVVARGANRRAGRPGATRAVSRVDPAPAGSARSLLLRDLLEQRGGPAVLRPGDAADVRVRQGGRGQVIPRVLDTRPRLRHLLLGRGLGLGLVSERADATPGSAPRLRRRAESARARRAARQRAGARLHRGAVGALRRGLRGRQASRAGRGLCRGDAASLRAVSGRPRCRRAVWRRLVSAGTAARDP